MSAIVVIGAGQAGASLVAKLRALGHDGPLVLIGDEPVPPYQRPPLSKKYLLGETGAERLFLRPESFYAEQKITLKLGRAVREIDPRARRLFLGDEVLAYDQLVLATGAIARRLPAAIGGTLPGVHCLRNIADVDAMAGDFAQARRVLIIGGGYVGLEAAAVAAQRGLAVTLIEAAPRILQRVACAQTADCFRALHRTHGVDIREGVSLLRLNGTVRGARSELLAELSDGSALKADLVIAGIGVDPDTRLAEAAGITVENGIATDAFGATSQPGIWAAGDCASFPHRGGRLRLESVQNAIDQAECVAENLLGAARPYRPSPWFWSDQYDIKLQIAGLSTGYREVIARGQGGGPRSHWYFDGEDLLAVDAINDPRSFMTARRALQAGLRVNRAAISDPTVDLREALLAPG